MIIRNQQNIIELVTRSVGMQSTIYFLQQQLKESKEQVSALQVKLKESQETAAAVVRDAASAVSAAAAANNRSAHKLNNILLTFSIKDHCNKVLLQQMQIEVCVNFFNGYLVRPLRLTVFLHICSHASNI